MPSNWLRQWAKDAKFTVLIKINLQLLGSYIMARGGKINPNPFAHLNPPS